MKYLFSAFLLLWFSTAVFAQDRIDSIRQILFNKNTDQVLVVAHRGDWRFAPENSLAAIKNAIALGVDVVELDVQRTKDGQLILMHDRTLNRTSTGKGAIKDQTLAEIKKLKLRKGNGIRSGFTVPTLKEALLLAKGKVMLNLDKAYPYFDQIYELLQQTGTTRQIIMKGSGKVETVQADFGRYLDKVIFMPIVHLDKPDAQTVIKDYVLKLQPVAFELLYVSDSSAVPEAVKAYLKGKSLIWYNTLWDTMAGGHDDFQSLPDPDKGYGYLIDSVGARIIQTDRPRLLLQYLRERKLHP